jgi:hypothetical protein
VPDITSLTDGARAAARFVCGTPQPLFDSNRASDINTCANQLNAMKRTSPSAHLHIPVFVERDRRRLERTAYHEAGHVVLALAAGRRFASVTVSSTERLLGNVAGIEAGLAVEALREDALGRRILVRQEWINALIALAGPVAEWIKKASVGEGSEDLLQAAKNLRAIRPALDLAAATRLARRQRRHVRAILEEAWPAAELMAASLLQKGTLQFNEAETIYEHALPDGIPADLFRCPLREGREADAFFASLP